MVEDTAKISTEDKDGDESGVKTPTNKFSLDSPVEDEGSNLSVGQVSAIILVQFAIADHKFVEVIGLLGTRTGEGF